ncbi:DUF3021 family protein [Paenibacillus alvei]|uniref:DUF3021 family protein n=1 Tax=Paenibacillus alvei TaxID=44250 RepID=UPI0018CF7754|nr:DUF3021 family protein [Paenibacillus alvei]MBG9736547.1 hypothetical protein [Paenibacillus alvei]MBG9745845.1 hypothetical protein [Paenibacillus alvei]MCY9577880.1 DUF3021 domain-containing protein [Paenibacillus alvei]MCY9584987.1 DUF3021 domain-containing protein [Paenibacillus alvei]
MNISEIVKRLARDYLLVFAEIVICVPLLNHLNLWIDDSDASLFSLGLHHIYAIMICALVGGLPSLMFYYPADNISEKGMRLLILIHFVIVEAVVLIFTNWMGWVTGVVNTVILAFEIAIIYLVVSWLEWSRNKQVALEINEQLRKLKDEEQ